MRPALARHCSFVTDDTLAFDTFQNHLAAFFSGACHHDVKDMFMNTLSRCRWWQFVFGAFHRVLGLMGSAGAPHRHPPEEHVQLRAAAQGRDHAVAAGHTRPTPPASPPNKHRSHHVGHHPPPPRHAHPRAHPHPPPTATTQPPPKPHSDHTHRPHNPHTHPTPKPALTHCASPHPPAPPCVQPDTTSRATRHPPQPQATDHGQ